MSQVRCEGSLPRCRARSQRMQYHEFIRVAYLTKVELIHYVCGECGYTESYMRIPTV